MAMKNNLRKSAEIISHLMNVAGPDCWGPYSIDDLSDCVNTCFALAGLLELAELERQAKGTDND